MPNSSEAAKLKGQVSSTIAPLELDQTLAHFKGLSLHVVFMLIPMTCDTQLEAHGAIPKTLADLVDAGHVKPALDEHHFAFDQAGAAYNRLMSGNAIGKVVVEV